MKQGFPPDAIGTDLHPNSIMLPQVSVPNCISKLMARAIKGFPELGTLGEGRGADIALFELQSGVFALVDSAQKKFVRLSMMSTG